MRVPAAVLAMLVVVACDVDRGAPTETIQADFEAEAAHFEKVPLGSLSGGTRTIPFDMDNDRRIVGRSADRPFLWENGVMTDLAPGRFGQADVIGASGLIGGTLALPQGENLEQRIVVWEAGVMRELAMDPAMFAVRVMAINEQNDVLAWTRLTDHDAHSVVWFFARGNARNLGHLHPTVRETYPSGMNGYRAIVGASFVKAAGGDIRYLHAYRWRVGVMQDLGFLAEFDCWNVEPVEPCSYSEASGINASGVIVGSSRDAAAMMRAVVWRNGALSDLGVFPGQPTRAMFINKRGDIAGTIGDAHDRAFRWRDGAVRDLGSLGGGDIRLAGMNRSGHVVGSGLDASGNRRAFIFRDNRMINLGVLPGDDASEAVDINDAGDVAGWSGSALPSGTRHALLWKRVP